MSRIDKENYYLDIAQTIAERSTCLCAHYGALIVSRDEIVSTGYNGAPRGRSNCTELGYCMRQSGECRGVPGEVNAIISASRQECLGSTLYLVGVDAETGALLENVIPCSQCRSILINAGVRSVIVRNSKEKYSIYNVQDWVFQDDSLLEPSAL